VVPFKVVLKAGVPAHEQVAYAAKKAIISGRLKPGDPFPSVRTLSAAMKIHANTAQRTIALLQREKLIEVLPGIGTVVAQPSPPARAMRARLLSVDVEALAVEAMRLGVQLGELQEMLDEQWRKLRKGKVADEEDA
jgi:GntR family transcriptional regulator